MINCFVSAFFMLCFISCSVSQKSHLPSALLWKISGHSLAQDSYIFGTIHLFDTSSHQFSPQFENAFGKSHLFAMELLLDENRFEDIFSWMVTDEQYSIYNYIDSSTYKKIDNHLRKTTGFQLKYFERIKPIFLYFMMQQPTVVKNKEILFDQYLAEKAAGQHKKVVGLETYSDQINALNSIALEQQWAWITESLAHQKQWKNDMKLLNKCYEKEQLSCLEKQMLASITDTLVYQKLIVERNEAMTQKIITLIEQQSSFIAVGAGHLVGTEGILWQLKNAGYSVHPMKAF